MNALMSFCFIQVSPHPMRWKPSFVDLVCIISCRPRESFVFSLGFAIIKRDVPTIIQVLHEKQLLNLQTNDAGQKTIVFFGSSIILVENRIFLNSDIPQSLIQHGLNKIRIRCRLLYGNRQPYNGSDVSSEELSEGKYHAFTCHGWLRSNLIPF